MHLILGQDQLFSFRVGFFKLKLPTIVRSIMIRTKFIILIYHNSISNDFKYKKQIKHMHNRGGILKYCIYR